jgi:hypothetical protein
MTVLTINNYTFTGLSTDTKPTVGIIDKSVFYEIDTNDVYTYDKTYWIKTGTGWNNESGLPDHIKEHSALGVPSSRQFLASTGNDQSSEIAQYLNDTMGTVSDFTNGEYILGSQIKLQSRKIAHGAYNYGLNMRGSGPGVTVLRDVRADKSTPLIWLTNADGTHLRNYQVKLEGFSLLSCDTGGATLPIDSPSGLGILAQAQSGTGLGAHVLAFSEFFSSVHIGVCVSGNAR